MVSSETEFCLVYDLIEKKYRSGIFTEVENEILEQFWDYHKSQWGPKSNVCYWYEAAHPFRITNNQGLESKNKDIKDNFTYREQLDIGQMFDQAERIICHNSKLSHENLDNWRPKSLLKDSDGFIRRDSHSIQEAGYGYYLNNLKMLPSGKKKKGCIVEVTGNFPYTLSQSSGIGKVSKILALKSSINTIDNKELQQLAYDRIQSRADPKFSSLEEYYTIRNSCHLVEVVETSTGTEYFCDCYLGIKGKSCKHSMELVYLFDHSYPIALTKNPLKFVGRKRGKGRPAKVAPALDKTIPKNIQVVEKRKQIGDNEQEELVQLNLDIGNQLLVNEQVQDIYWCTPCLDDGNEVAIVRCRECEEYLCRMCKKAHDRLKATRNHTVNSVNTDGDSQSSSVCQSLSNNEVQSPSVDVPPVSLSPVTVPPSTSPVSHSSGNVPSSTPVISPVSLSPKQTITSLLVNQFSVNIVKR